MIEMAVELYVILLSHGGHTTGDTAFLKFQIHPFNGPFSGTTWVCWYRKVKPIWILLKQETVSGSGISWAVCMSTHCPSQITMLAPHHSVFYRRDALPAAQLTASKHWRHFKSQMAEIIYNWFSKPDPTCIWFRSVWCCLFLQSVMLSCGLLFQLWLARSVLPMMDRMWRQRRMVMPSSDHDRNVTKVLNWGFCFQVG